ncbi:MAG TPA: signal peptidase II [Nocardioidaceae bacterium]|jgi:signal peptidase II|nr:signal peptidase II [Nocardioidaceae bacterium]
MQAARGASLSQDGSSDRTTTPTAGRDHRRRLLLLFGAIALVAYATDVVTKIVVVHLLSGRPPVDVVGHLLRLTLARNPGAAFSTGTSYTAVLSCIAIIAALGVLWYARRLGSLGWAVGLGFLLAGVLGNLTDRVFREPGFLQGHVIDFIMFPHFPVFNVADICINIAAAVIIVQALRGVRIDGTRHPKDGDEPDATGPGGASS